MDIWGAVIENDTLQLQRLIEEGADINQRDQYGRTPLIYAAEAGKYVTVKLLLSKHADPHTPSEVGTPPAAQQTSENPATSQEYGRALYKAALRGHVKCVRLLIAHDASVNYEDEEGGTALIKSAYHGQTEMLQMLLDNGANIEHTTEGGFTALTNAAGEGHAECIEILLKHKANIEHTTKTGNTALTDAATRGHAECLEILLKNGANIEHTTEQGSTALTNAAYGGHAECLQILLRNGANIEHTTEQGITALIWAAGRGHAEYLEILLNNGANIEHTTEQGFTALINAARYGRAECIEILLKHGANIEHTTEQGFTSHAWAAYNGHADCLELLLHAGADIELPDNEGKTPLMNAASQGHIRCVKILVKHNANIDAEDNTKKTALMEAARKGNDKVVAFLFKRGASVEKTDENDCNALMYAARGGHKQSLELLLQYRSDIDAEINKNTTLLMEAAGKGNDEVVSFCKEVKKTDEYGWNALMFSARRGHKACLEPLLQYTSDINHQSNAGDSAVTLAALNENTECLDFPLDNGANIGHLPPQYTPALHEAIPGSSQACADKLVSKGAKVESKSKSEHGEQSNIKEWDKLQDDFIIQRIEQYQHACEEGEAYIRRAKLVVLGAPGDGKTSTVNSLLGRVFSDQHVPTNAVNADVTCKMDITKCDKPWELFVETDEDLIERSIISGISQSMMLDKVAKRMQEQRKHRFSSRQTVPDSSDETSLHTAKRRIEKAEEKLTINEFMLNTNILSPESREQIAREEASDECVLKILDFGGQPVYHVLYPLFLSWHCVYALVINLSISLDSKVPSLQLPTSSNSAKMEYLQQIQFWLNDILSRQRKLSSSAEADTVIIVGTHKDLLHHSKKVQEQLAEQYFDALEEALTNKAHIQLIRKCIAVDNKGEDAESLAILRTEVLEAAQEHCCWNDIRPLKWLRLEKKLLTFSGDTDTNTLNKYVVPKQELLMYGAELFMSESDVETFVEFHNLTGDFISCPQSMSEKYGIINPLWLMNTLKSVISMDQFYPRQPKLRPEVKQLQNEGIIKTNQKLLREIWNFIPDDDRATEIHKLLLMMMVEFDLAVQEDETTFFIPYFLPICQTGQLMSAPGNLTQNLLPMIYRFHGTINSHEDFLRGREAFDLFLPHGIFPKLVAMCCKAGWKWSKHHKYQNSVGFVAGDHFVQLAERDSCIEMKLFTNTKVDPSTYMSKVNSAIDQIIERYYPNMWIEYCTNPCEADGFQCIESIGRTSLGGENHLVVCSTHNKTMETTAMSSWFSK